MSCLCLYFKCVCYFQSSAEQMTTRLDRVDLFQMNRLDAAIFVRDMDVTLLRQAFFSFRDATDRRAVFTMLAARIIPDNLFRILCLEAERHEVRLSTLVMLILRGYTIVIDNE